MFDRFVVVCIFVYFVWEVFMRVRWSQLVYRMPGSDNEATLARVYHSKRGDVMRFQENEAELGELEVGYLALVPTAQAFEDEIDMWVEVDSCTFFEGERKQWSRVSTHPDHHLSLMQWVQMLWWRWLRGEIRV